MVTRLFLRHATSAVSGTLPTAEQSTLTADNYWDTSNTDSINRALSRFKGTVETCLQNTSIASSSLKNYYVCRWVSEPLQQTSIAANTWTYNFGAMEDVINANFPSSSGAAGTIYVNCYVWKPSDGTKYGTILDGVTGADASGESSATPVTNLKCHGVTFTGSAVSSLTSGDACIVFEAWFKVTQSSATAYTQAYGYDGPVVRTSGDTTVTNIASYIETPEDLSFDDGFVTTKLYLHDTTSGLPSGTLPSAEQSTKTVTANCNFEGSDSTNRLMDTSIGASQASLALATPASVSASTFYVSRWVSPVIYQTSVAAGGWTYNFATKQSNTSANFPVTSNNKAVWVNCYVWKPSDGTKYGTILDGNTAATVSEGAANTELCKVADFTGAAVSSLTSGDACIVFEAWFAITQGSVTSYTDTYYYDGTTEGVSGDTVSNHASFIAYQGLAISFTAGGTNFDRPLSAETISISESLVEIYNANRAHTAETIAISESQTRAFVGVRTLSTETNTIGESLAKLYSAIRAPASETTIIGENLVRLYGANRALSDTIVISESLARLQTLIRSLSDTTAISESLARMIALIKSLSDITAISESIIRMFVGTRALSAETNIIGESLARLFSANRALSDTTAISESLARTFGVIKNLSDTITIGESLARVYNAMRALSDTTVISESITKIQVLVRSLSDTIAISEILNRLLVLVRSLTAETIAISESLTTYFSSGGVTFTRTLAAETVAIAESLVRSISNARSLTDTTIIGESLSRILGIVRALSDTTIIGESLARIYNAVRSLTDTITITGIVDRVLGMVRSLSETTAISESLNRLVALTRTLTDTTIISESLSKIYGAIRALSDTTIINESLARVYGTVRNLSNTTAINESLSRILGLTRSLTETTIISEILSRVQGLTRTLTDTTAITELLTRSYGIVKSLSDIVPISDSLARLTNMVRSLTESITILESLIRVIIREITDYVPSLETDFKDDIDKMVLPYIFSKWNATGQLQKGSNMIDANSPVEFKVGIHSSRPYQVLALEQQTEINKASINKFSGGLWRFFTMVELTVMVQRLQRDIPIELSQMEREIQRIICHYTRDEIVGIDDLVLVGMRREWTGTNKDWSKSIWSTKIYLKAEYQKVNTEAF